jgi:subtilase family protein
MTATSRLLVKTGAALPDTLALGAAGTPFTATPLFTSIGTPAGLGVAAGSTWHVLSPPSGFAGQNPWDLCHQLLQGGLGFAGAPAVSFAEPDLQQQWIVGDETEVGLALESCAADPQDGKSFPAVPGNDFWFRDPDYGQFDAALALAGGPDVNALVRIAHFDTGYDPGHALLPPRLRKDLARNFVDDGLPNDASDTSSGLATNLGHGTGTISILAGGTAPGGKRVGGAPFAEVVPIRVGDRVALFSNSAIARAFDYVHGLNANAATSVDIITMSMGGTASQAWAEAVNALYEQGVFIVTAAGNNFANLPTRNIVYPARFNRVLAACGVMADHAPYADLGLRRMAGNYGPDSKMRTALTAYTPNVPWAKFGCGTVVRFNGQGTSAATPQLAASAALWIQKNRAALDAYPQRWMRVEAIRHALFDKAKAPGSEHRKERMGRGELRAEDAMGIVPQAAGLRMEKPDSASFGLLRILTGLGAAPSAQTNMLELEALQLSQNAELEALLPDPDVPVETLSSERLRQIADALAARGSQALRSALGRERPVAVSLADVAKPSTSAMEQLHLKHAVAPQYEKPSRRPLRVYAYDPSLERDIKTLAINETCLNVRWEDNLAPGPVGEYIEVIDVDPASGCCYAPVDLNHPYLLLNQGLSPSETNPQFHQQMAYAVAMNTIEHFESALGRVALWAPRRIDTVVGKQTKTREEYVQRLRIYPHALRTANAFYSPDRKALLMGYFYTGADASGTAVPDRVVFSTLSHDIIAHETSHALLDGLHRRFREATNLDVLAFHEAFSDIVALFQHFTVPQALKHQIAQTGGDLGKQNLLAQLAVEFGNATGRYGALRDYIGKIVQEKGEAPRWVPRTPSRSDYPNATKSHDRGAVLVAAMFDAFLQIYQQRSADLVRLASQGTGVLPKGNIPVDLVERLAQEASKVARQVLRICIRALDYCPPLDLNFGDYLRALITADAHLVPNDELGYRTAFVSAFRDRGIYPTDVKHMSPASLVWEPPPMPLTNIATILEKMKLGWDLNADRKVAYDTSRSNAREMWLWLADKTQISDAELDALGLTRDIGDRQIGTTKGELRPIEVHSVRPARRVSPNGQMHADLVVEITQSFRPEAGGRFRGGCTLMIDLEKRIVRYFVRKRVDNSGRLAVQQNFVSTFRLASGEDLRANYFGAAGRHDEPFAMLHRTGE